MRAPPAKQDSEAASSFQTKETSNQESNMDYEKHQTNQMDQEPMHLPATLSSGLDHANARTAVLVQEKDLLCGLYAQEKEAKENLHYALELEMQPSQDLWKKLHH